MSLHKSFLMEDWLHIAECFGPYITHGGLLGQPLKRMWELLRSVALFIFRAGGLFPSSKQLYKGR